MSSATPQKNTTDRKFSLVVLISGGGSNLQSIINACQTNQIPAKISAVISNKADAFGLERAKKAGIPQHVIKHQDFNSREAFDTQLAMTIDQYQPDLVVLAGFMRILSKSFVERYLGKLINIHPSLLPRYPGLHTHQRALDGGDTEHGASVHFVTPELDAGPVIIQGIIAITATDNPESLAEKVLIKVEHQIYPQAIEWIAKGRIELKNRLVYLDREPLPACGHQTHY
ncbi:MAG: phosphoribosylglycinamide formyltransferase [Pseudomonadales bacterium]|nr:phosphoribosylglycinamide formyltransferase [Pseudomonadales bacterium]MCP5214697.1 phosphoribosylglycinamide formyltransferase [Pseudomonadales bacterium]MCP5303140.1 phosphoribosylglycinamide formyltransferase [Pseudomonadales bacterium]